MLLKIERATDKVIDAVGYLVGVLLVLMIINVAYDVFARYVLNWGSIGMQELEWHLFAMIILYGTGYTLKENAHVRVDFIYDNLSIKKKAKINIYGAIFFLIPLTLLVIYGSYDFVLDSYTSGEISEDPGGLPYRWLIKVQIPLAFIFLLFCGINFIVRNINILNGLEKPKEEGEVEL